MAFAGKLCAVFCHYRTITPVIDIAIHSGICGKLEQKPSCYLDRGSATQWACYFLKCPRNGLNLVCFQNITFFQVVESLQFDTALVPFADLFYVIFYPF